MGSRRRRAMLLNIPVASTPTVSPVHAITPPPSPSSTISYPTTSDSDDESDDSIYVPSVKIVIDFDDMDTQLPVQEIDHDLEFVDPPALVISPILYPPTKFELPQPRPMPRVPPIPHRANSTIYKYNGGLDSSTWPHVAAALLSLHNKKLS